jgi:hypothetical protein
MSWNRGRRSVRNPSEAPSLPFGTLLKSLEVRDLDVESTSFDQTAAISNSRFVTSYNWLDGNTTEPTILVPGTTTLSAIV